MGRIASRLWRAFFDANAYREVAHAGTGSCLTHLALAVVLVWLPSTFSMTSGLEKFAHEVSLACEGMPDVHIENGSARLDPPGRHEIALDGETFMVLDPESTVDEALGFEKGLFLTGRQLVIVNERRADARVVELEQLGDRVITEADVKDWLALLARYGTVVFFPLAVLFSFVWRLGLAALLALAGLAVARVVSARIDYGRSFRIATLAGIPTLVFGAVAEASDHGSWWPAWLGIACSIAYLTFGVRANRSAEAAPVAA